MIALAIISMGVAALLLTLQPTIKTPKTGKPLTNIVGPEQSTFNNSRGNFLLAILAGYLIAGVTSTLGLVVAEGAGAFSVGVFMLIASPVYAMPVLLMAATVGYPIYRTCRGDSTKFPRIWWAYSAAALASALCASMLATLVIFKSFESFFAVTAFVCTTSLVVAFTASLFTWARQRVARSQDTTLQ